MNGDLYKHFIHCGPIVDIQIRASGGVCVPTAKLPTPYWGMGSSLESVHYATVRFKTPDAARNAMDLSGTELLGKKIIVSPQILPSPFSRTSKTTSCLASLGRVTYPLSCYVTKCDHMLRVIQLLFSAREHLSQPPIGLVAGRLKDTGCTVVSIVWLRSPLCCHSPCFPMRHACYSLQCGR